MAPDKRSPRLGTGGEDDTARAGPFSYESIASRTLPVKLPAWPPPGHELCEFPIAGPDPLMGVFAADYYELRMLRRLEADYLPRPPWAVPAKAHATTKVAPTTPDKHHDDELYTIFNRPTVH